MKIFSLLLLVLLNSTNSYSQKVIRDHRVVKKMEPVILYENPNFSGESKQLGIGKFILSDFDNKTSSIKIAPDHCAIIYEFANSSGGYGQSVDLLENRSELSTLNFDNKTSYILIFSTKRTGFVWIRNAMVNGQFISGHWTRQRVNPIPLNTTAVVSPSREPITPLVTTLQVSGGKTTITALGKMSLESLRLWNKAKEDLLGIIGNDFRGIEEIGSASIERESHNPLIPDNLNFWYPQKQNNDHRSIVYFKRTLAGTVLKAKQVNIEGTFQDYDVNVDIIPDEKYNYLLTDAHPREYTGIMKAQYYSSLTTEGQGDCDDVNSKEHFKFIEAEIAPEYWPQGNHKFGRSALTDLCLLRTGKKICVYGPWIYDKGHCCHPEIHPAEQLWWSEAQENEVKYNCNVICDASKRFWWRKNMDDGTKLRPWAAPPVKGLFAIAFEVPLNQSAASFGQATKNFEVTNIEQQNVNLNSNAYSTNDLVYNNRKLVSFIPHTSAFKVSFENVGLDPATNSVKGFLVIETSVGTVTQVATSIWVQEGTGLRKITIPANSDPDKVDQRYENRFFRKMDGRYMFSILETTETKRPTEMLERIAN